jgi:CRISPR-associated protein Csm2
MADLGAEEFCKEGGLAHGPMMEFVKRGKSLKPTQLRRIFNELTAIEQSYRRGEPFNRTGLIKVQPKLAYAYGRGLIPKEFYELMSSCLTLVKTGDDFERFMEYVRAMMAYHKFEAK